MNNIAGMRPIDWLRTALYGVLLFFVYHSALVYLYGKWQDDDFTYCWMIPPIVLYLIWEKRDKLAALPSLPSWAGLAPLGAGIVLYWLGELGGEFTMQFLSLWLVIVAICWLHLGWRKLRLIGFPLVFGLASFVPPNALYAPITLKMKLISSQVGVKLMQLYGLSAYREGNIIDLGFTQLQVVDACNGLRYVIPLFMMGVLLAYYFKAAFWKKIILVLSTIPLSIFTNSLRIASVGVLYPLMGQAAAEGFFHDFSGWFIFMVSLGFLLLEMWVLKKVRRETLEVRSKKGGETLEVRSEKDKGGEKLEVRSEKECVSPLTSHLSQGSKNLSHLTSPVSLVVIAVLLATLGVAHGVNFREKTPLVRPFNDLPLQIGEWNGKRSAMGQEFLEVLKLSDYAMIDYRNPQGREVSFYVAYNASQSKGEATHSPGTCLPSSGWVFNESGSATIPGAGGAPIEVSRAFMEKNGVRQLVYYWFPQRGRILTNLYQVKFYNFWDALTRQRTDGALVRLITPLYGDETPEDAEKRLQGFAGKITGVLDSYIQR